MLHFSYMTEKEVGIKYKGQFPVDHDAASREIGLVDEQIAKRLDHRLMFANDLIRCDGISSVELVDDDNHLIFLIRWRILELLT